MTPLLGRGLGCGAYQAQIRTRGGHDFVGMLPWDQLVFGRVVDDTSQATVTCTVGSCGPILRVAEPWKHELSIYRARARRTPIGVVPVSAFREVWVGPVFEVDADPDAPILIARDLTQWFQRRFVHHDFDYHPRSGVNVVETTPGGPGVNEIHILTVDGVAGTYRLTYGATDTTATLPISMAAAALQAALEALPSIGGGNVLVAASADGGPYTITYQGALAETLVPVPTVDASGVDLGARDLAVIYNAIALDALAPDTSPNIHVVATNVGVNGNTVVTAASYTMAAQPLQDLANAGIDYTATSGRRVTAGPASLTRLPTLTDQSFRTAPKPKRDGSNQANRAAVTGPSTDSSGNPVTGLAQDDNAGVEYGLLEINEPVTTIREHVSANAAAESTLALNQEVKSIDSGVLSEQAPVEFDDLVAGVLVPVELGETIIQFSEVMRLKAVNVTVSPSDEQVEVVLQPTGTS